MKRLNMTVNVDPTFTADDWQLYTSNEGSAEAAVELNTALKEAVAKYTERCDVEDAMHTAMGKLRNFGASDSEPRWFLQDILDKLYGAE